LASFKEAWLFSINCLQGRFHLFLLSYTLFYDLPTYLPTYLVYDLPNLAASFIYTREWALGAASERPKFLLWAVKGTFTAWKLISHQVVI
jgi:hypothetical protein